MNCVRHVILFWSCVHLISFVDSTNCIAQAGQQNVSGIDSTLSPEQQRALELLVRSDTLANSLFWPHIKPSLFFANIRKNILYPLKINQGKNTNFCSYASLTHLLIRYQPDTYTAMILSLYFTGKATLYSKRTIKPSQRVRNSAGSLMHNGEMNIRHADQLWFLSMADSFKGYLNIFDHKYRIGDENTFWAATNYGKFNKMLREFGGYKVDAIGSDLLRPRRKDMYGYTISQLDSGLVMLYINSKLMYPHKFKLINLPAPTHFVVLYEVNKVGDMYEIKYWDYGLKTELVLTKKRLKKTIYGVSTITSR
jgi:hypothetical protein